ncbi:SPX-domain-containing protein, partial [Backusella circina FSU 941]
MKFSTYLESQSVPEWYKAYMDYKGSKYKLKQVENFCREKESVNHRMDIMDHGMNKVESNEYYNCSPSLSSSRSTSLYSVAKLSILDEILFHLSESERSFFRFLDDESEKITSFYRGNWFMKDPYAQSYQLSEISSDVCDQKTSYNVARNRLKKAITEYYTSLEFLKSYTTINATGFRKMLHKFDKVAGWKASLIYLKELKQLDWFNSKSLDTMLAETETIFVTEFADGQRKRGMKALRGGLENEKDYNKTTLRVGICLGMAIPLLFQSFLL